MATKCSSCGRDITKNETTDLFVICPKCNKNSAKNNIQINKNKEVIKMSEDVSEKKVPVAKQVRTMLAEGKTKEEISELLNVKVSYIVAVEKKQLKQ